MKLLFFVLGFVCVTNAQWRYTGVMADRGVIALHPSDSLTVFAAGYVGGKIGVYKSTDAGENWSFSSQGLLFQYLRKILVDPNNPDVMYVAGQSPAMGIAKSTDGGITWTKTDSGLAIDHHGYTVNDIALDAKRNILYAADWTIGGGIYRSTDGGRYWKQVRSEFVNPFFANGLLADSTDGSLYAWEQSLWVSIDSGFTWTDISQGLLSGIGTFEKKPWSDTAYITAGGRLYSKRTSDSTWVHHSDPLLNDRVIAIVRMGPNHNDRIIFVGCSWTPGRESKGGVFISHNAGMSWQSLADGIIADPDSVSVNGLIVGSNAFVSVHGLFEQTGLYKRSDVETSVEQLSLDAVPSSIFLFQNYPNPFNSETTIEFDISSNEKIVQLTIFDALGKEMKQIFNGALAGGRFRYRWNGKTETGFSVPSGVYFVRLMTTTKSLVNKLVIIR